MREDCLAMDDEVIHITRDDTEVVDNSGYRELTDHFAPIPEVAKPLLKEAKATLSKIEKMLCTAPSFVNLIKANIPDVTLQAVLTDEQKQQIAKGALKLMTKKDGSIMANLINPETKKIIATIPLRTVKMAPEITQAMSNYAVQMQMVQIAEQIQAVQIAIEEVHRGQEHDRLAMAYSCQQKFLQAMEIKDKGLRTMALMKIASDAEDSRNLLMLSQRNTVAFISGQPESYLGKFVAGDKKKKVDSRMYEIRESLYAVNMVSLTEAMAYQELGEDAAARKSLAYYADYIQNTYLSIPGLVKRLDSVDPSPENYWSKTLPDIKKKIEALPCGDKLLMIGEAENEKGYDPSLQK